MNCSKYIKEIRTTITVTFLLKLSLTLHILVSLLLTFNFSHILLLCFYCQLWTDNCRLLRYSNHLWLLLVKKSENYKEKTNMFRRLLIEVFSFSNIGLFFQLNISPLNLFCLYIFPGPINGILHYFDSSDSAVFFPRPFCKLYSLDFFRMWTPVCFFLK